MFAIAQSLLNLIIILIHSSLCILFQCLLYFFVYPFNRPLYRQLISELTQGPWINIVSYIFPGTNLVLSGTLPKDPKRPILIVANHQVDADWWYLWQLARSYNGGKNVIVALKQELKHIPIIGWGMSFFDFLFLKRNFESDKEAITSHMKRFVQDDYPFWMILFPEGTTIHQEYVVKSKRFAEKFNRPMLNHVLLPRIKGLKVILDAVKDVEPDIYDLTIGYEGYSGEIPTYEMGYSRHKDVEIPNMSTLLSGKGPSNIHIHGSVHKFNTVYQNVDKWLDNQWMEKEERLKYFIQHKYFPKLSQNDQPIPSYVISPKRTIYSIFMIWLSFFMLFLCLPLVIFVFFPCYIVWVLWTVTNGFYDRSINVWFPYLLELLSEDKETSEIQSKNQKEE